MPPSTEQLPQALDNWERYLHFDEKDSLVQLAVIKAQFEIIHPFLDGNGRLGPSPLYELQVKLEAQQVYRQIRAEGMQAI